MPTEAKTNILPNPPAGPGLHALVIGVSRYPHVEDGEDPTDRGELSRLKQLSSAARSAAKFAGWLLEHGERPGRPFCSLRVALSPTAGEVIPAAVTDLLDGDHAATRANVEAALGAFIADCKTSPANAAVVYVAGHGVQITKDGATLLLEDFGAEGQLYELQGSVDLVSVHAGMFGTAFPQQQFWFVDACRQRPRIASRFEQLQPGLGLDEPRGVAASSPLYLATVTGEKAYGLPGGESLFNQALLGILDNWTAAVEPRHGLSDRWHVSVTSLATVLGEEVRRIAEIHDAEQSIDIAGNPQEGVFHEYAAPPEVEVEIPLLPADALPCARTVCDDVDAPVALADDQWPLRATLRAGLYSIKVEPPPPFRVARRLFSVKPPRYDQPVVVEP